MAILTRKFSEFVAGSLNTTNQTVGLSNGANAIFDKVVTWTTATRPTTPTNAILGYNSDLQQYEFYDNVAAEWTQLEDSGDIAALIAELASHVAGEGASMIGLENQGAVASKTVQDLAESTLIAQTDNGTLANGQFLEDLSTGVMAVTNGTGVIASRILTGTANEIDIANGNGSAAPTFSLSATLDLPGTLDIQTTTAVDAILDEDNMASDSPTALATQQSIKAYADLMLPLSGGTMAGTVDMDNNEITGLPLPIDPSDAASKQYVDDIASNTHPAARVGTTAALTVVYDNGVSGVGATLTNAGVQAALDIDGVALAVDDRVLVKNQAAPAQNGIYTVTDIGSGATNWIMTRASDYDQSADMHAGDEIRIVAGTTQTGFLYMMSQTATIVVGTTDITWVNVTNSGLGTMANQDANAVAITGGTIDGTPIGETTAAAGNFTTITSNYTAVESGDHGYTQNFNGNGFAGTSAYRLNHVVATAAGQTTAAISANIDDSTSTGGTVYGLNVAATEGISNLYGLRAGLSINPVIQAVGTFANADSILVNAVDETADLASGGAGNVSIFVANNDTMTIGSAAQFDEVEFILSTVASGAGIAPTFEYSTGVGTWASFTPLDDTNGMRASGEINWTTSDLAGWALGAGAEFLIRITRTRNTLATTPIAETVQISATVEYLWNKDGVLRIKDLNVADAIQHFGDLNNQIVFGLDTQDYQTGGSSRLDISDSGVRLGGANARVTTVLDEDNMATNSPTALSTQQSIKAYADTKIRAVVTQVFTSSGTYTPTAGMVFCIVEVQAGGGGGGGTNSAGAGLHAVGSGAGGGGYAMSLFTAATIGASQAVTVGAGGAAGTAGGGDGGAGGTSSFGALIVCTGGVAGLGQPAAGGGGITVAGGGGTATTVGNLIPNCPGQHGRNAAGSAGNVWTMPVGGSSQLGQGGPGRVIPGGAFSTSGNLLYLNGYGYGGGGAGGLAREGGGTSAGGLGTGGIITVTEFISA